MRNVSLLIQPPEFFFLYCFRGVNSGRERKKKLTKEQIVKNSPGRTLWKREPFVETTMRKRRRRRRLRITRNETFTRPGV